MHLTKYSMKQTGLLTASDVVTKKESIACELDVLSSATFNVLSEIFKTVLLILDSQFTNSCSEASVSWYSSSIQLLGGHFQCWRCLCSLSWRNILEIQGFLRAVQSRDIHCKRPFSQVHSMLRQQNRCWRWEHYLQSLSQRILHLWWHHLRLPKPFTPAHAWSRIISPFKEAIFISEMSFKNKSTSESPFKAVGGRFNGDVNTTLSPKMCRVDWTTWRTTNLYSRTC